MDRNVYFVNLEYEDALLSFYKFNGTKDEHATHWHKHIFYEIHFSFEKTVVLKFKDREVRICPGEFLIIPPLVMHESIDYNSSKSDYMVLSLEIKKTDGGKIFYDSITNGFNNISLKPQKISGIEKDALMSFDRKELYSSLLGICELKMYAGQVMYMFMKKTAQNRFVNLDEKKVRVLIDSMILTSGISLGDIAEAVNYSKRQVSRLIKEQYGESFSTIKKRIKDNGKIQN